MQIAAISEMLAARAALPAGVTPDVVLVALAGVSQLIGLEPGLGVSGGHEATLASSTGTSTANRRRTRSSRRAAVM